ncbi:Transcription initiation factor TFIID, subunit TAF1 [Phaffia rhodozyma]|uniref:Transcription initiation factor TFIID, subunit TAF1 n=1 Tax=Phaffia rhodozyma TaxID=264483 RepID=A0A0F7SSX4_PHARH|nr:Transcription initiation factor TFIID, subunit TAF1 [Phaffia rhodozyma]
MAEDYSFLGDLALEAVLAEVGEGAEGLSNVGLGGSKRALGKDDIYNDNWEDDEDNLGAGKGKDWEKEIDEEMKTSVCYQTSCLFPYKYYLQGLAMLNKTNSNAISTASPSASPSSSAVSSPAPAATASLMDVKSEPVEVSLPPVSPIKPPVRVERTIEEMFPDFRKGETLNFVDMFSNPSRFAKIPKGKPKKRYREHIKPLSPPRVGFPSLLESPPAPRVKTLSRILPKPPNLDAENVWEDTEGVEDDELLEKARARVHSCTDWYWDIGVNDPRSYDMVNMMEWETQIMFDSSGPPLNKRRRPDTLTPFNRELDEGSWANLIMFDSTKSPRPEFLRPIEEEESVDATNVVKKPSSPKQVVSARLAPTNLDPYNISNDHHYEGMKHRVRQTFGSIIVQHSYPALKLQLPYFPSNIKLTFEPVKSAKTFKDKVGRKLGKGGDIAEGLRKPGDLTLKDTSSFVLWEFSEEHPPIMSGFGMGSVLVNYYRKTDDNDEFVPRLDLGEPFVLDPKDEPPYSTFAPIEHGQTQPTLYNNLIKAPLFRHNAEPTDFLVIRNTVKGEPKYYIREIKNLFVIGQTIPSVQIPGPHARLVSGTAKHRTHQVAFRLLQKAKGNRMKLSRLMKYFPDTHELQMRQRLKDFLEFHRRGPHQQSWRLKTGIKFPDPTELIKMVAPESVMMIESMQVGLRVLQDAGYGVSEKEEKDEDEAKMDTEQKLAPWIMTKTYVHSQRDKAWVQLYGEGDPTGRGEGFSFIRVSMKDIFLREGETVEDRKAFVASLPKGQQKQGHVVQERVFREEAKRIWDLQHSSLSNPIPPELSDDEADGQGQNRRRSISSKPPAVGNRDDEGYPYGGSSPAQYSPFPGASRGRSPSAMSRASSVDRDDAISVGSKGYGAGGGGKALKIKRLIKGEWKTEIVRDINVINAYVRKRQLIEEKETAAEAVMPTGDVERDKRMKRFIQDELDKLKKNQTRRINRKKALAGDENGNTKQTTSRKCANCGVIGHMKTNRKCPRWAEFNQTQEAEPQSSLSASGLPLGISSAVDHLPSSFFAIPEAELPKLKLNLGKKK